MIRDMGMHVVVGESMKPTLCAGQYVFICRVPFSEINQGDIVGIAVKSGIYVHRIVSERMKGDKYYTKGDNNIFVDDIVLCKENYYGKVTYIKKEMEIINLANGERYPIRRKEILKKTMYECYTEQYHIIICENECICLKRSEYE